MGKVHRHLLGVIAVTLLVFNCTVRAQNSNEELIIGKWRHIALVRIIDGNTLAPQQFNGDTVAEFRADGTWSLIAPHSRSAGTYKWIDSDHIEQTIVESNLAIQLGMVSTKQIRVDSSRLNIIVTQSREDMARYMPPSAGVKRPNEVTVTTIFSRAVAE